MNDDRVSWHLWNWGNWMRVSGFRRLWYPARASGMMGVSGSSDFDAMVATVDNRCAHAVDAIIDGLCARERAAVHHIHLAAVWRIRGSIEDAYEEAKMSVAKGLTARAID